MRLHKFEMHRRLAASPSLPFSRYTTEEARAEARFYSCGSKDWGFLKAPLMVNDFEDAKCNQTLIAIPKHGLMRCEKMAIPTPCFTQALAGQMVNNLHKKDLLILRSLGLKTLKVSSIQHRNFLRMMPKPSL